LGGTISGQSRELKFRDIFNSRAAQPSQVLDFESDLLSERAHIASAEPDEEKPNHLESFADLSPRPLFIAISAAESRKTAAFGLLTPLFNFAPLRAELAPGLAEGRLFDFETPYGLNRGRGRRRDSLNFSATQAQSTSSSRTRQREIFWFAGPVGFSASSTE
jgi:hypothetical protein